MRNKRIVIKIGSQILSEKSGKIDEKIISKLAESILFLKNGMNIDVVLVSSGAVNTGRSLLNTKNFKIENEAIGYAKNILEEQMLASIGQPKLMSVWLCELEKVGIVCGQILTTRSVFADREDYLSIRTVVINLLKGSVVPIFNENDVLSPGDLDFLDNDQQAVMIAAMLLADKLIILTDVDGMYSGNPNNPSSKFISIIENPLEYLKNVDASSGKGKGGMKSKLLTADLATSLGIDMHIANGRKEKIIEKIMQGEKVGTFFPAKKHGKINPVKNWLASASVSSGKIVVSTYLADIISHRQVASILFSGIEGITGYFSKKDVVEICNENGKILARGIVRFNSDDLRKELLDYKAKSNKDKLNMKTSQIMAVHYDNLAFCC